MEEKKTKNKPKLIYILIFTLALVLLLAGLFDMKANAAEYEHSVHIYYDVVTYKNEDEYDKSIFAELNLTCESPMFVYLYDVLVPITGEFEVASYVVSQSSIQGSPNPCSTFVDNNNVTWYCISPSIGGKVHSPYSRTFQCIQTGAEEVHYLNCFYTYNEFVEAFKDDTLDLVIDYDSFPIDDEMPVVENLKRNVIKNSVSNPLGVELSASETWDLISWTNTSDKYQLELQTVPIVQFYKISLPDNKFIKEYYGEWETKEIFNEVTNKYKNFTNITNEQFIYENANAYHFYYECGEKYSTSAFEDKFLYFGYRLRYIDVENGKKGPWVTLIPGHSFDSYTGYVSYSDDTTSDLGNLNGTVNEYVDMENIEDAIQDIETENNFKDKYETIDNEADIQEASNWLKTVVNFISGTPSVVGSVLSFLPQPILYGLYITIFLGVIASGIAIIRALI